MLPISTPAAALHLPLSPHDPQPRNNPRPQPQTIENVAILAALHRCFGGNDDELNQVYFEAAMKAVDLIRTTRTVRTGEVRRESKPRPIRRSQPERAVASPLPGSQGRLRAALATGPALPTRRPAAESRLFHFAMPSGMIPVEQPRRCSVGAVGTFKYSSFWKARTDRLECARGRIGLDPIPPPLSRFKDFDARPF